MSTADNRFAGMREELVPGKLRGYRQWAVPAFQPRLRSMGQTGMSWDTTELTAECVHQLVRQQKPAATYQYHQYLHFLPPGLHQCPAPDPTCTCGIYGWYRPEDTSWMIHGSDHPCVRVLGAVEVWGKVLMGSRGFRAQHARILGLLISPYDSSYELESLNSGWRIVSTPDAHSTTGMHFALQRDHEKPPKYTDVVNVVRDKYPVPIFETLEELCGQFPPDDVSNLVPDLPPSRFDPRHVEDPKKTELQKLLDYYGGINSAALADILKLMGLQ